MMKTAVPEDFRVTWSHSSLDTYKRCPLKYWAEKIGKVAVFEQNEKTKWGEDVHAALENRVGKGVRLPSNMAQYEPIAQRVIEICPNGHELHVEKQFAITEKFKPTDWFGDDAHGRAIADVLFCPPPTKTDSDAEATVIDYKTGKYWGRTEQGPINAIMVFAHHPHVQSVKVSFWYLSQGKVDQTTYTRDQFSEIFLPTKKAIDDLNWSIKHQNFPAKKNFLCKNYCGHFNCEHNGRNPQ